MALVPLSKAKVKLISALARKKYRQKHQLFVVEGHKVVREALKSDWELNFVVLREDMVPAWEADLASREDIPWYIADQEVMDQISSQTNPEGSIAVLQLPPEDHIPALEGPVFVLDDIRDPGNLGTILRCADWFGFTALVCSQETVDAYNPKVIRAAMGSLFRIPVYKTKLIDWLQSQEGPVYIADLNGKPLDRQFRLEPQARIIIGNEARGLNPALREALPDASVLTIPRFGAAESLNAAMTAAILGWHLRQG